MNYSTLLKLKIELTHIHGVQKVVPYHYVHVSVIIQWVADCSHELRSNAFFPTAWQEGVFEKLHV